MKRATSVSIGLFLLVCVLAASHRPENKIQSQDSSSANPLENNLKPRLPSQESPSPLTSFDFEKRFKTETLKISHVNNSGDDLNSELSLWANQLDSTDLLALKNKALNVSLEGDERALAIFILAKSNSQDAIDLLKDVALSESHPRNPRQYEFEQVMKGMAVEGISNSPHKELAEKNLLAVARQSSEQFVVDRTQRGLAYLKGEAKSPEQQDLVALEKLLSKSL